MVHDEDLVLAEVPGLGRVFDCGNCGNLHLTVGPISLTLSAEAYMQLVTLLNTSAANFETWIQTQQGASILRRLWSDLTELSASP